MAKFRAKKIKEIEAEQFMPPYSIPKGVMNVYSNGSIFIGQVTTIQGERVTVKQGEWIVKESQAEDRYYPIANDVFLETYEPIS